MSRMKLTDMRRQMSSRAKPGLSYPDVACLENPSPMTQEQNTWWLMPQITAYRVGLRHVSRPHNHRNATANLIYVQNKPASCSCNHSGERRSLTWGLAPPGPVTSTARRRPSLPCSAMNSTGSPSRRLRKPSVRMLVCGWWEKRIGREAVGSIAIRAGQREGRQANGHRRYTHSRACQTKQHDTKRTQRNG